MRVWILLACLMLAACNPHIDPESGLRDPKSYTLELITARGVKPLVFRLSNRAGGSLEVRGSWHDGAFFPLRRDSLLGCGPGPMHGYKVQPRPADANAVPSVIRAHPGLYIDLHVHAVQLDSAHYQHCILSVDLTDHSHVTTGDFPPFLAEGR